MIQNVCNKGYALREKLQTYVEPLVLLGLRLKMADFFYTSGKLKLDNFLEGRWEDTVAQFRDIYPVPGLPAEIAAPMGTAAEVGLSVLVLIGLFGRLASVGMLALAFVIYYTHMHNIDTLGPFVEMQWVILVVAVLIVRGPGPISVDKLLFRG